MVSNYYEHLVLEKITEMLADSSKANDEDYIADVACVALNKLPARYVRHIVDLSFYMTEEEKLKIDKVVEVAVAKAMRFIDERTGKAPDGSAHK